MNQKIVPEVYSWPTASITYGESLSQIKYEGGRFSVPGFMSIKENYNNVKPCAGSYSCEVTFNPYDSHNYETVSRIINITVNKATPKSPNGFSRTYKSGLKLSDFSLPQGWKWKNPNFYIN